MGLLARIFGRTANRIPYSPALGQQVERAVHGLQAQTAAHDRMWQIGTAAWNVDQDVGTIVFTASNGMRAVAPVQIVGTYDTGDSTWLWGWDHPSVAPALAGHARRVLEYGQQHGFGVLTTRKLTCPEEQCWDFAAMACMLCDGQGAYRGPIGTARVFFTFGKVTLSRGG